MTGVGDKKPFSTALGLLTRTTPFLFFGALIYGGTFLALMLWIGGFGWLAFQLPESAEVLSLVFLFLAVFVPIFVLAILKRYFLYLVQAGHIAVATTLLYDGELPDGQGQVAYGRSVVQELFGQVSVLWFIDRAVDRTLRRFTRSFSRLSNSLPGPLGAVVKLAWTVVARALSYVDEAVLSYAIAQRSPNVYGSARHGTILFAQAYKPILGSAVRIWLLGRVAFVGFLIICAIPAAALIAAVESPVLMFLIGFAALVATLLLMKLVFEPFALIYTLVTYHTTIAGMQPDPVWDERLQGVSRDFKKLIGRSRDQGGTDTLDHQSPPPAAISGQGATGQPSAPGQPVAPAQSSASAHGHQEQPQPPAPAHGHQEQPQPPAPAHGQQERPQPPTAGSTGTSSSGGSGASFASMAMSGRRGRGGLGRMVAGGIAQAAQSAAQASQQASQQAGQQSGQQAGQPGQPGQPAEPSPGGDDPVAADTRPPPPGGGEGAHAPPGAGEDTRPPPPGGAAEAVEDEDGGSDPSRSNLPPPPGQA